MNFRADHRHFEQLFKTHYPLLYGMACGYIRESTMVEEIVCDVFVRFWNSNPQLDTPAAIRNYLYKSAKNACIDYLRKAQKQPGRTSYIDDQTVVCHTLADLDENPLNYLITEETERRIMTAIDELPERYRQTFTLVRLDQMSYDEAALAMGISKNTVKSNLKEAVAILQQKLKDLTALMLFFFTGKTH